MFRTRLPPSATQDPRSTGATSPSSLTTGAEAGHSTRRQHWRGSRSSTVLRSDHMKTILFGTAAAVALISGTGLAAQAAPPAKQGHHARRAAQTELRTDVQAHVGKLLVRVDAHNDGFVADAGAE